MRYRLLALLILAALLPALARASTVGASGAGFAYVQANASQSVQFFYTYGSGCSAVPPGTAATTSTPQNGTVSYNTETHVISAGSPCAGSSLPGVAAYYDWTNTVPALGGNITAGQVIWGPSCGPEPCGPVSSTLAGEGVAIAQSYCNDPYAPGVTNCMSQGCPPDPSGGFDCYFSYLSPGSSQTIVNVVYGIYASTSNVSCTANTAATISGSSCTSPTTLGGPVDPPLNQCETLGLQYTATDGTTLSSTQTLCPSGQNLGCPQCSASGGGDPGVGGNAIATNGPSTVGQPIDLGTGNMFERVSDYATAGQNPLAFVRTYNSQSPSTVYATELGPNWRSNYDLYLRILSPSLVTAERGDGKLISCGILAGTTQWMCDTDQGLTLAQSGSAWTITDANQNVETYATLSGGAEAVLSSIQMRNGYTRTLTWTGGLLTKVTDSYGRTLTLGYTGTLLTSLVTPDSTKIVYGYTAGQLTSVTYPTSPAGTVKYGYSGIDLTSVTDENGHVYDSWGYDSQGRATSNSMGNGIAGAITIKYNTDGSRLVTNALGQADTHKFTMLYGLPRVSEIDRAATSTVPAAKETFTYDGSGHLATMTDWNGKETLYQFLASGLPLSVTEGVGTAQARTTTWAYDPVWTSEPDEIYTSLSGVDFTYDGMGNVASRTVEDFTTTTSPYSTNGQVRQWLYTWGATGLLASVQEPRTDVTALTRAIPTIRPGRW
jgi:YD repeat-containing protein